MDEKTIETLRQAVQLSSDNVPLRLHFAGVLEEAQRWEEARDEYRAVVEREATSTAALIGLGRVLLQLDRPEEAAARLADALRIDGKSAPAYLALARALLAMGAREKAAISYRRARTIDPNLFDGDLELAGQAPAPAPPPQLAYAGPQVWDEAPMPEDDEAFAEAAAAKLGINLDRPEITFNDVGGMHDLKEEIRVNIIYPFTHPEVYAAYGKKVGGGILLYGPPGCGKTFIARATAGECNARFTVIGIEDVLDTYIGQSERNLHTIFETARRLAPTVLFFDELDALAGKRSDMDHSPHARSLVNQFLAETDGAKGDNSKLLIIGATNSPWHVDPAFRRPGRFDKVIFVPPPDQPARTEILKIHCAGKPVETLDYAKLAARMKRFSGADIAATVDAAAEIGLRETLRTGKMRRIQANDFQAALKAIRPTTEEWLATAKNYVMYSNQAGLYDAVAQYLQQKQDS